MQCIHLHPCRTLQQRHEVEMDRMECLEDLSDGQLVTLGLAGKREAYAALIRRHQPAVYAVAYRLLGERQDALDVTQEAFVRAFGALASYDRSRPLGPWLNRIATNLALSWLGRPRPATLSLQVTAGEDDAARLDPPDMQADPERVYLEAEQQSLIQRAILGLPPHYRAVIELRHFQDLAYDEIAETLGLPVSDVKSHLFRARQMLRNRLERLP